MQIKKNQGKTNFRIVEANFTRRVDQQTSFHRFGPNWRQLNSLDINFPLTYVRYYFWKA